MHALKQRANTRVKQLGLSLPPVPNAVGGIFKELQYNKIKVFQFTSVDMENGRVNRLII